VDYRTEISTAGRSRVVLAGAEGAVVARFPKGPSGELAYALFVAGLRQGPNTLYDLDAGRFVVPATKWPDVTDERRAELKAFAATHRPPVQTATDAARFGETVFPPRAIPTSIPGSPGLYVRQEGRALRPRYPRKWWQFWEPKRGAVRVTIKETSPCK